MSVDTVLLRFHVEESNALEGIFATRGIHFDEHMYAAEAVASDPGLYLRDVTALHRFFDHSLEHDARPSGAFRAVNVSIGSNDMPHYRYIHELMDAWYGLVQKLLRQKTLAENIPVMARVLHHEFLCIHPFADGNGRCARLLMNAFLLRRGHTWAVITRERKQVSIYL